VLKFKNKFGSLRVNITEILCYKYIIFRILIQILLLLLPAHKYQKVNASRTVHCVLYHPVLTIKIRLIGKNNVKVNKIFSGRQQPQDVAAKLVFYFYLVFAIQRNFHNVHSVHCK
jgi:hypothetical protein